MTRSLSRRGAVGAILGASAPLFAQDKAKRVIDDVLGALGGDRFLQVADRTEMGRGYSFYRERLTGLARARLYTRYLVRPSPPVPGFLGVRERQSFGKSEDTYVLLGENYGYDITFRGARPLPKATLDRFRETTLRNIFYILRQRLGEPGLAIDHRGMEMIDNIPTDSIDITDNDNRVVKVHFHHSTKFPVRQVTQRREPGRPSPVEEVTNYSKFRDVGGGVMWPFVIQRERDGEAIFSLYSESVTINQDLTDNLFTLPGNIKVIPPK
ncbi:MAG: hypothetical protein ACKV22_21550 [Bryobacteraceae bacterium]